MGNVVDDKNYNCDKSRLHCGGNNKKAPIANCASEWNDSAATFDPMEIDISDSMHTPSEIVHKVRDTTTTAQPIFTDTDDGEGGIREGTTSAAIPPSTHNNAQTTDERDVESESDPHIAAEGSEGLLMVRHKSSISNQRSSEDSAGGDATGECATSIADPPSAHFYVQSEYTRAVESEPNQPSNLGVCEERPDAADDQAWIDRCFSGEITSGAERDARYKSRRRRRSDVRPLFPNRPQE